MQLLLVVPLLGNQFYSLKPHKAEKNSLHFSTNSDGLKYPKLMFWFFKDLYL